jgi:hypothetical protein
MLVGDGAVDLRQRKVTLDELLGHAALSRRFGPSPAGQHQQCQRK